MKKSTILSAAQLLVSYGVISLNGVDSKLADRSRVVKARHDSGRSDRFHDNGRPIEGQSYRSVKIEEDSMRIMEKKEVQPQNRKARFQAQEKKQSRTRKTATQQKAPWQRDFPRSDTPTKEDNLRRKMKGDVPMFIAEDMPEDHSTAPATTTHQ